MKPKMTMDGKPAVEVSDEAQVITAKATSRRKLLIVGSVIGLVCLVVIGGVSIGAFYMGMNAERESVQDAWVNFKAGENKTIIKERVIVREKEAEFRRPGVMSMVVDYENNVLVIQFDDELEGDEDVYCYVYDYEPGMFGTHEDAESIVNGDETRLTDPNAEERFKFESTGEHMSIEQLSPSAREMCHGSEIVRVRKTDKDVSERRKRGLRCSLRCGLSCFPCRFYCRLRCRWSWG